MSRVTAARPALRSSHGAAAPAAPPAGRNLQSAGFLLAGILAVALIVVLWSPWRADRPVSRTGVRFSVELAPDAPLRGASNSVAAAPDGKRFAYVARAAAGNIIYLHNMDELGSRPIPGTESGEEPSFSPDGEWLAFNGAGTKLVKIPVSGGAAQLVCELQNTTRGIAWVADSTILFGVVNDAIFRVNAAGGTPEAVTTLDTAAGEISHRFPQMLPDGKTVLFTVKHNNITTFNDAVIAAQRIGGERKILVRGGAYAKYLPTGHLMYLRGDQIFAVPFDPDRLEVRGAAVAVERGGWFLVGSGSANVDFSADGTLVFAPTGSVAGNATSLGWMDRTGAVTTILDTLRPFNSAVLSPDGQRAALGINAANNDVWVYHIPRGVLSRITFGGGNNDWPIWSPDGSYVVYSAEKGKTQNLFRKAWDGNAAEERLTTSPNFQTAIDITPDGKILSFNEKEDIWVVPLEGTRTPRPFIHSPAKEYGGIFSPAGQWMSYVSDESGRQEVYVTSFPEGKGKWQISNGGGEWGIWSRDGKRLYYFKEKTMMAVDILASGAAFDYSLPRKVFDEPANVLTQDIANDDARFLVTVTKAQTLTYPRLEVVTNWFDLVKSKFSSTND